MKISFHTQPVGSAKGKDIPQSPIVIVDDDEAIRAALASLLQSLRFRAEGFASAEDFLQSAQRHDTACLILDVRMPGMNGLELQRQLVAAECHIPIIFITAQADEHTRARALQAGAVDFLAKPFSEEVLLNAMYSALKSQDATSQGSQSYKIRPYQTKTR